MSPPPPLSRRRETERRGGEASQSDTARNDKEGSAGGAEVRRDADECYLLRDIFGNPFRPVTFDPRWRTSDVVGLAQAIYDDKAFERMPILADALMDAGCEEEQIIGTAAATGRTFAAAGSWIWCWESSRSISFQIISERPIALRDSISLRGPFSRDASLRAALRRKRGSNRRVRVVVR